MKKQKILAIILATFMMLALFTSCNGGNGGSADPSGSSPSPSGGGTPSGDVTINIGNTQVVEGLDPTQTHGNTAALSLVYECVFTLDKVGNIIPQLADSYNQIDDLTMQINLKPNVTFSNGDKMTAEDVIYSLKRYSDPDLNSSFAMYFAIFDWDNTIAKDDNTVILKTLEPSSQVMSILGKFSFVVDKSYIENGGGTADAFWDKPVGTGPYTVKENISGSHTTFTLRDDYWNKANAPKMAKEITLRFYSEISTMFIDFQNGALDLALGLDDSSVKRLQNGEMPNAQLEVIPEHDAFLFCMAEYVPAFQNQTVRQAIAIGVDWNSVAEAALGSLYKPSTSVLPDGEQFKINAGTYAFDPDKAKQMLADAGYQPGDITLNCVITNDNASLSMSEAIQAYMSDLGITYNFQAFDPPTALPMIAGGQSDTQIQGGHGATVGTDPLFMLSHANRNTPLAPSRVTNEDVNTWYYDAAAQMDAAARQKDLENIQNWFYQSCQWVPICDAVGAYAYNKDTIAGCSPYSTTNTLLYDLTLA